MKPTEKKIRVFVYGSLKRGFHNNRVLEGQTFVAEAVTQPCYHLFSLGAYPGMIERDDGRSIHGEVWEVDAECKKWLDALEGVGRGFYDCVPAKLQAPFVDGVVCYLYHKADQVGRFEDAGDCWQNPYKRDLAGV